MNRRADLRRRAEHPIFDAAAGECPTGHPEAKVSLAAFLRATHPDRAIWPARRSGDVRMLQGHCLKCGSSIVLADDASEGTADR